MTNARRNLRLVAQVLAGTPGVAPAAARPRASVEPADIDALHDLRGDEIAMFRAIVESLSPARRSRADEMLVVALAKQMVALRKAEAKVRDGAPGGELELRARLRSLALLSDSVRKLSKDVGVVARPRPGPPAAPDSWDGID